MSHRNFSPSPRPCPALLISAPASRQGKTLATAALARLHTRRGYKVRVFKCGPDFLDPQILSMASSAPVYQLDLWIQGLEECRRLLWRAAGEADLILVEGVMGLFDGHPSAADLSLALKLPVLAVIDVSAMAGTVSAVAFGLARYNPALDFAGVLANRIGSPRHLQMASRALRESGCPDLRYRGGLRRSPELELPSRHLGLAQAHEIADLTGRLDLAADMLENDAAAEDASSLANLTKTAKPVLFLPPSRRSRASTSLRGQRVGVARDEAFSFIYQANLDFLRDSGVETIFFSPLRERLPDVDSLYLPGGYPELHLEQLSANLGLFEDLKRLHHAGKPILAEGGGLLYLLRSLQDQAGVEVELAGLLPGRAARGGKMAALGSQSLTLPEGTLRGHTFHHYRLECDLEPLCQGLYPDGRPGEFVYRRGSLTASFIHAYFPSNPDAVGRLFQPAGATGRERG